ncbi:MAG: PorT family protein [Melioribacteraceae bacterium]|nr:PorT family protein [Melioribacteraceae bacterium]MCF8413439.1 PorT family protein [Melioribacteraceae bacterium]MCF8432455.1 PorT family protein [Melioribacteraceae bacterium]
MKKYHFTIGVSIILLSASYISRAQSVQKPFSGFGLELGIGNNELIHELEDSEFTREYLTFAPLARVFYEFPVHRIISLKPFIGYVQFGGKSSVAPNGYQDDYTFHAIEYGTMVLINYRLIGFRPSIGVKGKYAFSSKQDAYGSAIDDQFANREWFENDVSDFFKSNTVNLGIKIDQEVGKYGVGLEAWFGFTDMNKIEMGQEQLMIFENHYRLVFTYKF